MAEAEQSYDILLALPRGLSRGKVIVDFSLEYNRIPISDPELESSINKTWEDRLKSQPSLYNGTKFRLEGFDVYEEEEEEEEGEGEGEEEEKSESFRVILRLGLTDYKTFMGTNLHKKWRNFLSESSSNSETCQHMSNAFGNAAIIETCDNLIITLQRGTSVGEFPSCPVFPGGHSEPSEVGISSEGFSETPKVELNRRISDELFDGIIREIVEETGVPSESLTDLRFLGIAQRCTNIRPISVFKGKCSLSSKEILEVYKKALHGFESTKLICLSLEELREVLVSMPGCHMGAAALYEISLCS